MKQSLWWLFFISVVVVVSVGTYRTIHQEGYETYDSTCGKDAWIRTCLDVSNGQIQDYETFNRIVNYLSKETNDIQTRANIKYSIDPVSMQYMNPVLLEDPGAMEVINTVKIGGQVPNLKFVFSYPTPLIGPDGPTGGIGNRGSQGPVGPTGPIGEPALQKPE